MRICFLAHASHPRTRRLAAHFQERGHHVSVVSLTPAMPIAGVDLHIVQRRWPVHHVKTNWQYLWSVPHLAHLIRRLRPDLINAQFVASNGVLGGLVRPKGCPLVVTAQGSDLAVIARRSRLHAQAARFALSSADLVLSAAPHLTRLIHSYPGLTTSVLTLQYGVDFATFHPPPPEAERKARIVSARALTPNANVDVILAAARHLAAEASPLITEVVHEGSERAGLEEAFADLVAKRRIRFRGKLDQDGLADRLQKAALYVSMTSSDGASMTLLEAMACGAFPVVSDIAANRDWIDDGVNGFLIPLGNPRLLADRLESAWRDRGLRAAAAAANWQIVQERADFRRNMAIIESAFVDLARSC